MHESKANHLPCMQMHSLCTLEKQIEESKAKGKRKKRKLMGLSHGH